MKLDAAEENAVRSWIQSGASLAEVQRRLEDEFSKALTYLETRFLVDDLELEVADRPAGTPTPELKGGGAPQGPAGSAAPGKAAPGSVAVSLDTVTRAGALVSGTVVFSDGVKADWSVDQVGRLSLNPTQQGYRPSNEDFVDFQQQLQTQLESRF